MSGIRYSQCLCSFKPSSSLHNSGHNTLQLSTVTILLDSTNVTSCHRWNRCYRCDLMPADSAVLDSSHCTSGVSSHRPRMLSLVTQLLSLCNYSTTTHRNHLLYADMGNCPHNAHLSPYTPITVQQRASHASPSSLPSPLPCCQNCITVEQNTL